MPKTRPVTGFAFVGHAGSRRGRTCCDGAFTSKTCSDENSGWISGILDPELVYVGLTARSIRVFPWELF